MLAGILLVVSLTTWRLSAEHTADFTLDSPTGAKAFKLSEARGKYVALHFLLKTECPFCLKHTQEYFQKSASTPGVIHVFLKPDSASEIKQWAAKAASAGNPAPPIYRDPDARLARNLGVPDGYRFHGEVVRYPALILLGPEGKEVFRYVGKSNADRFSYERFEAKLAELRK